MSNHIVIYSHGFSVQKDDGGLLTKIAEAMPHFKHELLDYNTTDEASNTLSVAPLQDQVCKLHRIVERVKSDNPDAVIDVVAHSLGCVVAAIANPENIRRAILLAPPSDLRFEQFSKLFSERPGSVIEVDGLSRLSRNDGSTMTVPSAFWKSLAGIDPVQRYNRFSEGVDVAIVEASQDEVLGTTDFDGASERINFEPVDATHNFTGEVRQAAIELIKRKLGYE